MGKANKDGMRDQSLQGDLLPERLIFQGPVGCRIEGEPHLSHTCPPHLRAAEVWEPHRSAVRNDVACIASKRHLDPRCEVLA